MLNEQLQRIKSIMRLDEVTAKLDYTPDYFIKRIPFLKIFKNFSNDNKVFFQKVDYNKNVKLMVGDDLVTFPQFNTSMEFIYMKDIVSTGNYRHMFTVKNDLHIVPPQTNDKQEELTFRVLLISLRSITEKMEYRGDINTKEPNLTDEQLNEVINGINKAYFEFEAFINDKLKVDITNPLDENVVIDSNENELLYNEGKKFYPKLKIIDNRFYVNYPKNKGSFSVSGFKNLLTNKKIRAVVEWLSKKHQIDNLNFSSTTNSAYFKINSIDYRLSDHRKKSFNGVDLTITWDTKSEDIRNKFTQSSVVENINEDYPTSFNMDEFKTLKSFNKRIQYCEQHLNRISSGSSRIVYAIDQEKVLKLAKNKKGIDQNLIEISKGNDSYLSDIVANIFNYEENGLWVEMEFARKLTESDFKRVTGFNFIDYSNAISNYYHDRTNYRNGYKKEVAQELVDAMWEDEFVYGIFQYIGGYEIPVGDLLKLSSYGVVKRDGQDQIVVIDYGLNDNVYNKHYAK